MAKGKSSLRDLVKFSLTTQRITKQRCRDFNIIMRPEMVRKLWPHAKSNEAVVGSIQVMDDQKLYIYPDSTGFVTRPMDHVMFVLSPPAGLTPNYTTRIPANRVSKRMTTKTVCAHTAEGIKFIGTTDNAGAKGIVTEFPECFLAQPRTPRTIIDHVQSDSPELGIGMSVESVEKEMLALGEHEGMLVYGKVMFAEVAGEGMAYVKPIGLRKPRVRVVMEKVGKDAGIGPEEGTFVPGD